MATKSQGPKKTNIAQNRRARHDYEILDSYEAGVVLHGAEVKSLREKSPNINDSFCIVRAGELWWLGSHISPYSHGGVWNRDPDRRRKLLLHKKQIMNIEQRLKQKGLTCVPLELYFDENGRVKLRIGIGRGKKEYDKRKDMADRQVNLDIQRAMKERYR